MFSHLKIVQTRRTFLFVVLSTLITYLILKKSLNSRIGRQRSSSYCIGYFIPFNIPIFVEERVVFSYQMSTVSNHICNHARSKGSFEYHKLCQQNLAPSFCEICGFSNHFHNPNRLLLHVHIHMHEINNHTSFKTGSITCVLYVLKCLYYFHFML